MEKGQKESVTSPAWTVANLFLTQMTTLRVEFDFVFSAQICKTPHEKMRRERKRSSEESGHGGKKSSSRTALSRSNQ